MYNAGYMMGMHGFWWLFWLLLVLLLVALAFGWRWPDRQIGSPTETPHQVLRRRLASGEITVQDYEQRKALLDQDTGHGG